MTSLNSSDEQHANDGKNTTFIMPTRIQLFPNHDYEQRAKAIANWYKCRTSKAVDKLTHKHVLVKQDEDETPFIQWNPDAIPSTRDVKEMLDWYTLNNIHYFPQVKSVKLLGVGLTNVYFLVRFYTPHDIPGQRPTMLPEKVYLRLILPLHSPESEKKNTDTLMERETSMEQEITAMCLVHAHTSLAPRVYLFDSYAQNEHQLEWLIMEPVQGFVLEKCIHESNCTCETGLQGFAPFGRAPVITGSLLKNISREINDALNAVSANLFNEGGIGITRPKMRWEIAGPDLDNEGSRRFRVAEAIKVEIDRAMYPSFQAYFDQHFESAFGDMDSDDRRVRRRKLYSRLDADGTPWREYFEMLRRRTAESDGNKEDELWLNNANFHTGNILLDHDGHVVAIMGWEDSVVFPKVWLWPLRRLNKALKYCTAGLLFSPLRGVTKQFEVTNDSRDQIPKPRYEFGFDHGCPDPHRYSQTHFRCDADRSVVPKTPLTPVKEAFAKIFKKA